MAMKIDRIQPTGMNVRIQQGFSTEDVAAAKGAAAFAVTALPGVSSWLEHLEAKKSSSPDNKMAIRSFKGFSISLPIAVILGAIIAFAILNIGNFLSGLVVGALRTASQVSDETGKGALIRIAILAYLPVFMVGFYLLGKWVSWRGARNGLLAVILIALLTALLIKLLDFVVLPPNEWKDLYEQEKSVSSMLVVMLPQIAFVAVPALIGFWRGRRHRTTKYMDYLLSALPEETRNSLVDLAYDEVTKIVDARRSNQPQSSPAILTAPATG
jgi:hypothetical protein